MSGVATLKVRGAKRVFDEMAVDLPLPPQGCSPARYVIRPPPLKRGRTQPSSSRPTKILPPTAAAAATTTGAASHPSTSNTAAAATGKLSAEELAALARHVPRRLKRVVERVSCGDVAAGEKLFTVADLRDIVTSVIAEREAKLSEEFANILNDRLAEQFRDFTKFNEDYVSRQLRGRDFAYLS